MTTIEDVAKMAGLSRTTVSRVINNHPYVTDIKRKKVQDAMETLGYVPNSAARRLRNQKTETLAVIIPRITNPFFSRLVEALEFEASRFGYRVIMCQTSYSKRKELDFLQLLKTKQVDGIIFCSIHNNWEHIQDFAQYGPIVFVNEYDMNANLPMIKLDQVEGAFLATSHLIELGHDRLMFCAGTEENAIGSDRQRGFERALVQYNLLEENQLIDRTAYTIEDGKRIFHEIARLENRPTGIFTGGDEVAVGIISEAKKYGWRIPEDLAVVGFDNQPITELMDPTITTVDQPVDKLARKAIEVILEKVQTKEYQRKEMYEFGIELVVRESTVGKNKIVQL